MEPTPQPNDAFESTPRQRLSTRIVASLIIVLFIALTMISGTLWISWQLQGAAAAINDAGSLRMGANRVGIELEEIAAGRPSLVAPMIAEINGTLSRLSRGDPARPLALPDDPAIRAQMQRVTNDWRGHVALVALQGAADRNPGPYLHALPAFIAAADNLVGMIERNNAQKTDLLRMSQAVLAAIACAGTVFVIYLFYLWIIAPVMRLQQGIQRMATREFSVRLPVDTQDEFGVLARGFNHMADELAGLYSELEARVDQKTAQLAAQNRELTTLYDVANFINQPNDVDSFCRGFLDRVVKQFGANAGSIRIVAPGGEKLHMVVSQGLSDCLEQSEHCMEVGACFCGQATRDGSIVIQDFRNRPNFEQFECTRAGFLGLAVFRVVTKHAVLGSFALHFRTPRELPQSEHHLLDTLGQQLGGALENLRLEADARQHAIDEERNLVAQGLHDSIAQGLNFLNLQVQMLDNAVAGARMDEVNEIVRLLQTGVSESYQDVRELLANFRSKLSQCGLKDAIEDTLARFRRQTGVPVKFEIDERQGAPLSPDQQLQVLFILQEALSNVRKHAHASQVMVTVHNARDFTLVVTDDGDGFDMSTDCGDADNHIGLRIMRERAARMAAKLDLHPNCGKGVQVALYLAHADRQAA